MPLARPVITRLIAGGAYARVRLRRLRAGQVAGPDQWQLSSGDGSRADQRDGLLRSVRPRPVRLGKAGEEPGAAGYAMERNGCGATMVADRAGSAVASPDRADGAVTVGSERAVVVLATRPPVATHRLRWCYLVLACGMALLALFAVFTSSPGWYVTDNRFEHFWSPDRLLYRVPSLWDSSRSLGGPRGELALAYGFVLAGFRALVSPAVAERLFHALLLTGAGMGMSVLLGALRPRFGPEHVLAGLFYAFNPYSAVFLIPSGLFLHYALAPWLLVTFVLGATRERAWRWAAVFALLVWASGTLDPPGLAYSLVLFVPTAVYLVVVEGRARWSEVFGWLARASVLTMAVSVASLVQLSAGAASLAVRLFGTESVDAVHRTSSWAESWRGLGFWPLYFPERGGLLRQHQAGYLDQPALVLASFAPAIVALAALGWLRWRPRLLLIALALVSITLMVGTFPQTNAVPFGQLLADAYRRFPALTAMRTGYKAGAGLAMGLAGLLAVTTVVVGSRLGPRWLRALPLVGAVALIGVNSFPFWTGNLYSKEDRMREVPSYWLSALGWLDRQPGSTRVLVVPGTSNTRYRWGSPGDDIIDALLARPHVVNTAFPQSTARAFDLERAIDAQLQSGRYRPGTLAPVARRLGIEYLLVRNDLDWQRLERARPSMLQAVRDDPDLELVAAFGRPGEHVVAPDDRSLDALGELDLHPVEIFRIGGVEATARLVPVAAPRIVAGDGRAWLSMAAGGILDDDRPILYSADSTPRDLADLLGRGAPVVVTDTNRRQVSLLTRFGQIDSHTLAAGEDIGRPPTNLFDVPGSQTVAVFADADAVVSASTGAGAAGYEPWHRPANAFDDDPDSSWMTGALEDPIGSSLRVAFRQPVQVSTIDLVAAAAEGSGRRVSAVTLRFSDGSTELVDLRGGTGLARFSSRWTASLEVRIEAVEGPGSGPVGLSEVDIPTLDLLESIQVPDDIFRAAEGNAALERALVSAPVHYLFERFAGDGPVEVERALQRRFRTAGDRSYRVEGEVVVGEETPDDIVDALIGGPVGAYGTSRFQGALDHRGGLAVDGRRETGWVAPAEPGSRLTVRFPRQRVGRVEVTVPMAADRSAPTRLLVRAAGVEREIEVDGAACRDSVRGRGTGRCSAGGAVTFPSVLSEQLTVEVLGVEALVGRGPRQALEISEVVVGAPGPPSVEQGDGSCATGVARVGRRDIAIRRLGPLGDLLGGRPVRFEACDELPLAPGWHDLETTAEAPIDRLVLTASAPLSVPAEVRSVPVSVEQGRSGTLLTSQVPDGGGMLVAGQAYDPGWTATADGRDLGPAAPLDAQVAWTLPDTDSQTVELSYRPQRRYDAALGLSWVGLALCLWLALPGKRS